VKELDDINESQIESLRMAIQIKDIEIQSSKNARRKLSATGMKMDMSQSTIPAFYRPQRTSGAGSTRN